MNQDNQESGLFILGKPYKIPGEDREALKYFRVFSGMSVFISILRMKFCKFIFNFACKFVQYMHVLRTGPHARNEI